MTEARGEAVHVFNYLPPVHPLEEGMAGVVFNELEEDALTVPVVS